MDLATLNAAPADDLASTLRACVEIDRWVDALVADRPYVSRDALLDHATTLAADWTDAEVDAALAQHPRIGERSDRTGADAALSAREQSGVSRDDDVAARLRDGNAAYEARFDRVFLVRAAGRDADEILTLLEERLDHDDATEAAVVKQQLGEIALLRLAGVVDDGSPH